jgi:peptide/nickel transport system permease protein
VTLEQRVPVPAAGGPQLGARARVGLGFIPGRLKLAIGGTIVAGAVVCAIFAPWLAPHSPTEMNLSNSLLPPASAHGGSTQYLLGTDYLGRDVLSRLIYGARVSLIISSGGVLLAAVAGSIIGLVAGYFGGWLDALLMRIADVQLSLPFLLLVVVLAEIIGSSYWSVIVVFGFAVWPVFGRLMRSEVLRLKGTGFIESARALGASPLHNLRRHVLPNAMATLVTVASFQMAAMIIYEAGLGFLGLSVPPTVPSWGNMLADGQTYLTTAWWLAVFSGLAVLLVSLGINLLGDWLRDHANRASR